MRRIINPYLRLEGYNCFGCCPDNPVGLHMEFFEDGDDIVSFWRPQDYYQGWHGVMHGGILSTLVDEIAGWVVTRKLQRAGVTSRLNVSYLHPVKTSDAQLTIRAHISKQSHGFVFINVAIADSQEQVCVEGEAVYRALPEATSREMGFTHCDVDDEQLLSM